MKRSLRLASAGLMLASALPLTAQAESSFTSGNTANLQTQARVNFQINIPKFVSLRVGSAGGTIDTIAFSPLAADVGVGGPQAGTGGDLTNGRVTVRVAGNNGDMTLDADSPASAPLTNGAGDTIAWTQITVTAANGAPAHPVVNGGSVALPATNRVVNILAGDWTYAYANAAVVPEGTYTGQIVYTATVP
jgi:hypothetical protein